MKTLTKSLHTVTAVSRVAAHMATLNHGYAPSPADCTHAALNLLGYDVADFAADDATLIACVKATAKLIK